MSNIKFSYELNDFNSLIESTLTDYTTKDIQKRIWDKDNTVWANDPKEITNRLDWMYIVEEMQGNVEAMTSFAAEIKEAGFTDILLLGMGGSSLAPEVFSKTFGEISGYPKLHILDSTEPKNVIKYASKLSMKTTLFIVATKSGGTVETISFMKYFYNRVRIIGENIEPGTQFVAITDPGSGLQKMAEEYGFRKTFINNPNIGGRFSALSFFGLLPAALAGIDVKKLLDRAALMVEACKNTDTDVKDNPGAVLGAFMAQLSLKGVDKLTLVTEESMKHIGAWIEQLVAESTGKHGKGILPVDAEDFTNVNAFESDRCFVYMRPVDTDTMHNKVDALKANKFPVMEIVYDDNYDIGALFYLWEYATAVSGWVLEINPFDQPDVESAKVSARAMLAEYEEKGSLPKATPKLVNEEIAIYTDVEGNTEKEVLNKFVDEAVSTETPRSYISLQAYLEYSNDVDASLMKLKNVLRDKYNVAVTLGYGPRFLHSTGQLHKGDSGNGIFMQFTSDKHDDAAIPEISGDSTSHITFGTLVNAQAMGDKKALLDKGRKVITINIKEIEVAETIDKISKLF